jgi:poly-gamma-glutamate synthesis protein (capsule biosynthesis protein)
MHPRNVECLNVARVDCCLLANNHVLDWGRDGLLETLTVLRATGIQSTGAGRDTQEARSPAIFKLQNRARVLVFALGSTTSGIPRTWAATTERPGVNLLEKLSRSGALEIARQIKTAKRAGDIVMISIHWGGNWGYEIPHVHREFAYTLIEEGGADAVHGHSSHHPMAIEIYRGRPIFYGCGDLINDYEGIGGYEAFRSELALMYFPTISAADGRLLELRMKPMAIRKFRLNQATQKDTEWMAKRMDRECRKFGTRVTLEEGAWLRLVT